MKLDRLLAITMLLLSQSRVNASELSRRFEVSLRTIYRDMEAINQAGVPIVSFPGTDGGYELMPGYRIEKQMLTLEEFGSIIAALRGMRSAAGVEEIDRLLERISALAGRRPDSLPESPLDLDHSPLPRDRPRMAALHGAIREQRLVSFSYLNSQGQETERTAEPMGLFMKNAVWYLYGYCLLRSGLRVFRLSRMLRLERLERGFARRPYTLQDIERQFMDRTDFRRIEAELIFRPEVRTRVRDEFGYEPVEDLEGGFSRVAAGFSSLEKALQTVLSYGSRVEAKSPPELVERVRTELLDAARLYAGTK
ncbi:YafY family transcriptional regulator [Paenibacillus albicereus]|uniref:YafY family transcriptional regulator n=1 Tax=Paenibacillus albicereus TaxID=2726185 RepID=A0A6H2GT55_9BACL|nr:YafY family protein [Paenibacillus albicereus]QJC50539.1 YafY family transcriptional regulator [Paenibacillus albicereus]